MTVSYWLWLRGHSASSFNQKVCDLISGFPIQYAEVSSDTGPVGCAILWEKVKISVMLIRCFSLSAFPLQITAFRQINKHTYIKNKIQRRRKDPLSSISLNITSTHTQKHSVCKSHSPMLSGICLGISQLELGQCELWQRHLHCKWCERGQTQCNVTWALAKIQELGDWKKLLHPLSSFTASNHSKQLELLNSSNNSVFM